MPPQSAIYPKSDVTQIKYDTRTVKFQFIFSLVESLLKPCTILQCIVEMLPPVPLSETGLVTLLANTVNKQNFSLSIITNLLKCTIYV